MKHIVKRHIWQNGVLRTYENDFAFHWEAMEFANSIIGAESVKVYNYMGELVFSKSAEKSDTYA